MPSKSSKSSSIRPRDTNLKPIKIKSEVRSASERGASSPLIVVYGFLALILFGAILLFLPFSHNEPISFIDSLFTATSASTVTGLTVLDTSTSWSLFGQIVIAFLIVIGGIGFMTGAAFFLLAAGQSLGLRRSVQIGEGLGADNLGSIGNLVWKVVLSSLSFQIAGIFIFFILFSYSYGFSNIQQNAWYSIFPSISSFNNAGFTIFGFGNNLEPFSRGAVNNIVLIVTTVMFFFGGIGYFVMNDL
ncbi:MAG: potassium transporter TrkG, partial [Chloroflexota bacterium]|nr:potassium transporter TrkG [Chloroflexota bacterium]